MDSTVRERMGWTFTPQLYDTVHRLWIEHSLAEDRRDLAGLIARLTPDCLYEVVPTGQRWEGHAGGAGGAAASHHLFPLGPRRREVCRREDLVRPGGVAYSRVIDPIE